ncbi:hypothetical protein K2X85_09635 [bacterium]|nr:hypothetical protein [bacterium]
MFRYFLPGLVLALSVTSVSAATIEVAVQDFQASGVLAYTFLGSEVESGTSGLFRLGTQNPVGALASVLTNPEFGFCIELTQNFSGIFSTYNVGDLTTANDPVIPAIGAVTVAKANLVRQLWSLFYDPTWESAGPYSDLQIAACIAFSGTLYEILSDFDGVSLSSLDISSGNFTIEGAGFLTPGDIAFINFNVPAIAQIYIANLSLSYDGPLANLVALTSPTQQDYIVQVIPEASSMVLAGMGLLTLVAGGYRTRRRSIEG